MVLGSKELSLDLGNGFVPKTISDLLREVSDIDDSRKLSKLNDFVYVLEQEMKKIHAFKRELPVCMLLLRDAIDRLKEEVVICKGRKGKDLMVEVDDGGAKGSADLNDKKNWMNSAQLWTTPVEFESEFKSTKIQDSSLLYQQKSGNEGGNGLSLSPPVARGRDCDHSIFAAISQASVLEQLQQQQQQQQQTKQKQQKKQEEQQLQQQFQQRQQQSSKKQRRSWSQDLHRRFVIALQQLGGAQEATPKQIRELMRVDNLTNDEVKSHLQKYRLHIRKMASTSSGTSLGLNLDRLGRGSGNLQNFRMTESGSLESPLHLGGSSKGISFTIGESLQDEEDEKSDSQSWKGRARSQ